MTIALENWRWHGAIGPAEAAGFVLSEANCIKRNPVRRVYLTGDCYVKIEFPAGRLRRLGACWRPKAAAEYGAARRLAAAGMPVVEYLGWGQRGGLNAVVSRRWPDGEDVHSYFYRELVYGAEKAPEFYAALLDFLNRYRHCGVNHPDFHLGNVLYRPDDRQFTLVDVYRVGLGGREGVRRRQLGHFLLELRAAQPLEQLLDWGAQLGLSASLLRQELADARAALRRELLEELGVDSVPADRLYKVVTRNAEREIRLHFIRTLLAPDAKIVPKEGQEFRWVELSGEAPEGLLAPDLPVWNFLINFGRP